MSYTKQERAESLVKLQEMLQPGDVVYTNVNHVSRSGMMRCISLYIVRDGEIQDITWRVARVLDNAIDRDKGGIKVTGCGMDMCFATVYHLGRALWPHGHRCAGQKCRSNDHNNYPNPKRRKNSMLHNDSGYALDYRSL